MSVSQAGIHTLHVWMRESGLRIDQILLTQDANYVPPDAALLASPAASRSRIQTAPRILPVDPKGSFELRFTRTPDAGFFYSFENTGDLMAGDWAPARLTWRKSLEAGSEGAWEEIWSWDFFSEPGSADAPRFTRLREEWLGP